MAGSRIEKFGTIYTRLQGLLRSGALKEVDRPIWASIYEAFPPKQEPLYERKRLPQGVRNILYPEDFIRVKFYQTYGNPDVVDLSNETVKTTCQKFVERYLELQNEGVEPNQLFEKTTGDLRSQGIRLRTADEVQQVSVAENVKSVSSQASMLSVADIFGEKTVGRTDPDEEEDFITEESDDVNKPS